MEKIAIVTDSAADIPDTLAAQHQIHIVPNILVVEGKEYEDGKDMTRQEFYSILPRMKTFPTTATSSSGAYHQLYSSLLERDFNRIISIHLSSVLSGIYNAASIAAQAFGGRIHVIDSQQVSLGVGFQVLAAAKAALSEPADDILKIIEDIRQRVRVVAMLDTLEYVRRSGRVSWARARLGELLMIKPLIEIKAGRVISLGEVRTRHKGIERLRDILYHIGHIEELAVVHTNAEADALAFLESLQSEIPAQPLCVNVTPAIGTHAGPNALGFAVVLR
jgi:DegV family protein with EDD domain